MIRPQVITLGRWVVPWVGPKCASSQSAKFIRALNPSRREASGKLVYRFQSDSSTLRWMGAASRIAAQAKKPSLLFANLRSDLFPPLLDAEQQNSHGAFVLCSRNSVPKRSAIEHP